MAAVGMAWGLYDSLRGQQAVTAGGGGGASGTPAAWPSSGPPSSAAPVPAAVASPLVMPPEVARVVRLAASAAGADGQVADNERALLLQHARQAGVEAMVDDELRARRPLTEIVAGVSTDSERRDLYVLAVAVVRADETISGAERIYLAQLAHALGLDAPAAAALEQQTAAAIDGTAPAPQAT